MKEIINATLKYIIIAIIGVILFFIAHRAALPERPTGGIGGEVFLLGLPLFWWLVEKVVGDLIGELKREWAEIKAERAAKEQEEEGGEKQ